MKARERAYVVTVTTVADPKEGRGSNALTRDSIRLEIAMRLVAAGRSPEKAWAISDEFILQMDEHLPAIEEPGRNAE